MCQGRSVMINSRECTVRITKGKFSNLLDLIDSTTGRVAYSPSLDTSGGGVVDSEVDVCLLMSGGYQSILLQLIEQGVVYQKFHVVGKKTQPVDVCQLNFN